MSTQVAPSAFSAEGHRALFLAATFLKHVHERHDAGMRAILDVVNSSGLVSEFVAAMAAITVGLGRRVYGEEELGRALQDYAIRFDRASFHDHAPDRPWGDSSLSVQKDQDP
jgi:hypothetical protein